MIIEKINVTGPNSFKYIREQLKIGKTLSNSINELPIEKGLVYSFAPNSALDVQIFNFESGGLYSFDEKAFKAKSLIPIRNDSRPIVINEIQFFLQSNNSNCCLFEEPAALTSDALNGSFDFEYVQLNNNEIYYFFNGGNNSSEMIKKAFIASEGYIFLCALSSMDLNESNRIVTSSEVTTIMLETFVKGVSSFIIGAYDHEGYLMWKRD